MKTAKKMLREMFLSELTPLKHAETELGMSQSVARGQRKHTADTARMQSDVDSAQSLVKRKNEAEGESTSGLRITGDKTSLEALGDVFDMVSRAHSNQDLAEWAESASEAIMQGMRTGTVTLPAFKPTPGLDSFDDDDHGGSRAGGSAFAADEEY